jgi:YVTN family beta-propeller protein
VWVVDAQKRKPITKVKLGPQAKPMGVVVNHDGSRVYVSTGRSGTVEVLDAATNKVVGSVAVGPRPWGIALTPDGKKLYSANGPSNDVSVVDVGTLEVTGKIPVGKIPWGVAVGPAPKS